ncbi:hypothetical protein NA56DRAFT_122378 [Hyaloscypha hepaticicola]|uniref:Secreted protein n=1 Tax=Hyaloscypha hepaticicola TaxID=2082293 RepID=A0A2J6Q633_9HELO|nr:hypothetical protein NA56DRAFT_122378 [Hyaloscypha hepaticicola]
MLRRMTIVFGLAMLGLAQPGSNGARKFQQPARDFTRIVRLCFMNIPRRSSWITFVEAVLWSSGSISCYRGLHTRMAQYLHHQNLFLRHLNRPLKSSGTRFLY